jgi:ligand-binding sensor domain-containing protein
VKIKQLAISFFLLLLLQPFWLFAQTWSYRQYTAEQGLPSTEVYDIIQDKKGYIWVSTDRGVARFDGYSFESFTTAEGLLNNVVFKMCEGPDGKIWFGEMPGTLSYYERGKIYPAPENPAIKKHFQRTSFPVCMMVGKDYIDVGYTGYGILRLQQGKIRELYATEKVRDIVTVNGNDVLFGSTYETKQILVDYKGKHYFDQVEWKYNSRWIKAMKRRNGDLMVTHSGAVWIFNKEGKTKNFKTDHILLFFETPDSCLYAVSKNGFYRYGPNEAFVPDDRPCHLKGSRVNKIIMDREGGIWIATLNQGVFYCAHPGFITYDFKDEFSEEGNLVYAICGNYKGKVFASLLNGSIYYLNQKKKPVRIFSRPRNIAYGHIYYDTVRDYLLPNRFDHIFPAYQKQVRYLPLYTGNGAVAYKNGYLIGNYNAFDFMQPQPGKWKWKREDAKRQDPRIQCMMRLTEDSIFVGTLSGLYLYQNRQFKSILTGTPYAEERINDIECINHRKLVLATIGKGLLFYDLPTGKLEKITSREGLCSDVINDVALAPDGTLWLATNKGLSCLKENGKGQYDIRNYTSYSGIPVADIKNIHVDGNTIYMGTHNGLMLFDPRVHTIDHDPEILLRAVYVNDKKISPEVLTHLNFQQNNLRISYLSIIPKMLGKVLYRYQLKGAKNDQYWIYVKEPQLFLSSVEPGNYQLIVQACNSAGQWSKIPLLLPIHITAPFWKTSWFIVCFIAFIVGAVVFLQSLKLKRLRENAVSEKLMLDYQQQALINQINPHFLFNSMNSIQKYILRGDKEEAVSFVSKFAKLMRLGLEQSREAFIPLSEELELLKVYMLLEGERFGKKITYQLDIQEGLEQQQLMVPPMLIQPFIENAIRHGILHKPGKGEIILRLYIREKLLFCEVEDDGVGRKRAMEIKQEQGLLHKSFALSINTARLQLLTRSLNSLYFFDITDKQDQQGLPAGTLVKLILPFKYEHQS